MGQLYYAPFSHTYAAQNTQAIVAGVSGRRIGIRALIFTQTVQGGAGIAEDGGGATIFTGTQNAREPMVWPQGPDEEFYYLTASGRGVQSVNSVAGVNVISGLLVYEIVVVPTTGNP